MDYKVKIDEFEGPLDLLLHLIKESNIDIYDIKVEEVTKQYLEYINAMEEMNLSIASEYLVMAAELIEIKSMMLLPKPEVIDDKYEADPREDLIKRLIDYKKYKEVTGTFKDLEMTRKFVFTKSPENYTLFINDDANDISITNLVSAFEDMLKRTTREEVLYTKSTNKEISVIEKIKSIRKLLKEKKQIYFEELFEEKNKTEMIVSFLSILELIKKNEINIIQESNFNRIIILLKEKTK